MGCLQAVRSLLLAAVYVYGNIRTVSAESSSWIEPIEIKGYKTFLSKTSSEIQWKGVACMKPSSTKGIADALTESIETLLLLDYPRPNAGKNDVNNVDFFGEDHKHIWMADLDHIQFLGANVIRIYAINPSYEVNHDPFFCELSRRGIYAIIGVGAICEGCAIGKEEAPSCYAPTLKTRAEMIIAKFSKYSNVLFIEAGNEVNHAAEGSLVNAPCQKALIRDMRRYVDRCAASSGMRRVPIGVVVADYEREVNAKYYLCNKDKDKLDSVEWYGINAYLHCDPTVKDYSQATGLKNLVDDLMALNLPVPAIFGEFGCLHPEFDALQGENGTIFEGQRSWDDAKWILEDMRNVFIGGVAFEFSTENTNSKSTSAWPFTKFGPQLIVFRFANKPVPLIFKNYGTGFYTPEDCDHDRKKCSFVRMPNYYNLKNAFATAKLSTSSLSTFSPESSRTVAPSCPSEIPGLDQFDWPTDNVESIGCPNLKKDSLPKCSEPLITIDVKATVKPPTKTSPGGTGAQGGVDPIGTRSKEQAEGDGGPSSSNLSAGLLAGIILGAVSVITIFAVFTYRRVKNRDVEAYERRPSKSSQWQGYAPVGTPNENEGILRL